MSVAFRVPGVGNKDYVIDGDCANCEVETPRSPAIYANHSAQPNAVLQVRLYTHIYIEIYVYVHIFSSSFIYLVIYSAHPNVVVQVRVRVRVRVRLGLGLD